MSFLGSVETMWDCQRGLSRAQATPVIGPLLISPIKAVISLVQLVAGFVLGVVFASISLVAPEDWTIKATLQSFAHAGEGLAGLGYSLVNILTCGLAAYRFEAVVTTATSSV